MQYWQLFLLQAMCVLQQVKREVGDVSILVNNAGVVTGKYTFSEAPDNLVDRTLRVNVAAHFWVCHLTFIVNLLIPDHMLFLMMEVLLKTLRYLWRRWKGLSLVTPAIFYVLFRPIKHSSPQ